MVNNIGYPIPAYVGVWVVRYKDTEGWPGVFGIFIVEDDALAFFETLSERDKTRIEVSRVGGE